MSENVIQASFAAGELSPSLFARVDFAKYRSGAATMRNFFVDYRSGASTRTGTEFIRPGGNNQKIRLVRFQQSNNVTYVLEFGPGYLRFITQAGSVVEPVFNITSMSHGSPAIITTSGTPPYANGNLIFINGVTNPPQLNRYAKIAVNGVGQFSLFDQLTNEPIDSSNWALFGGSGTVQRVYTVPTPYGADDLATLKFSQNANRMNITSPNHPPYVLTLFNATNWTLVPAVFGATVGAPVISALSSTTTGSVSYKYCVTAVDENGQEGQTGSINVLASVGDLRTTAGSNFIQWFGGVAGAVSYNIYAHPASYFALAGDIGGMGFIGSVPASVNYFVDSNIAADFSSTPPIFDNPFAGVNPQVSSYFQQRLIYGNGGGNLVQTIWASKVGAPYNFDISNPVQANDAITAALVSLEVNEIKSMIPMPTGLVVLTTKGAWLVSGGSGGVAGQGGPLTPTTITATPQAYVGANDVPPILINYDIIFVQAKGSIIRDLTYNIYANIYTGNDISIMSSHMFYGHQILEWAYAEEPFKIVWCVREDGILLSLTLVKEQDMYGWARHDTLGNFKSVCTVTEGQTDATYVVVERPIPGNKTALYIERISDRVFTFGAEDAWCVDSGIKTPANLPDAVLTTLLSDDGKTATLMIDNTLFDADSVGQIVRANGGIYEVITFTDTSTLGAKVLQSPTDMLPDDPLGRVDKAPSGSWSMDTPFTTFYGLDHLEGCQVSVLADGGVINGMVVHDGSITLPHPATKVIAGLGFQAQLQTMYLDIGQEVNTVQGKRKKVAALTVRVKDSRGAKAGMTFGTVTPIKEMNRITAMGLPVKLITADERIIMDPSWNIEGQICIQVDDPVPVTVLGVVPEVVVGDTAK